MKKKKLKKPERAQKRRNFLKNRRWDAFQILECYNDFTDLRKVIHCILVCRQSRNQRVKCRLDGELSGGRKG